MSAKTLLQQLLYDEQGATAVEYGLIAALIVIAMITALQGLATSTVDMWLNIETKVDDAVSPN
ncbi:MAG: Flp family type IVb pilin [Erythrobacter sp.]|nr:MAG: Flp family type IVb pilin [Erythrobacter sp.]